MDFNAEILKHPLVKDGRGTLAKHATKTWASRDPSKLKGVVYHQSLAHNGSAAATAKYHVGPNHISADGLPGLSYSLFVERQTQVVLANRIEDKTPSQGDASKPGDENADYLAVCFGGNFNAPGYVGSQEPSLFQLNAAVDLWVHFKSIFGFKNNQLFGHYDFGKATCPGNTLQAVIEAINGDKDWTDPQALDLATVLGRQQALAKLGFFKGPQDGTWDNDCKLALIEFQKSVGLGADGVWGKMTQAAVTTALGK